MSLIGHPIVIKLPEHLPKSPGPPKSITKLTLSKPAIKLVLLLSIFQCLPMVISEINLKYILNLGNQTHIGIVPV